MSKVLYHGEPNGPSLTVLAALFETGVAADLVRIDLAAGARHELASAKQVAVGMSVEGEGPVLVVDGEGLTDSVFLGCYLDDVAGGGKLRPTDPLARWEMMAWCRQIIERTAPAAAFLGCDASPPRAPAAMLENMASDDLRARWEAAGAGQFAQDKLEDSRAKIAQAVDKVEARLEGRDWLMGAFSLADLESYSWLAGMVKLAPAAFAGKPRIAAWLERVRSRPCVARALKLATQADPASIWAPGPEINRWG